MKCIILDYGTGTVKIISFDRTQENEIEKILSERYGYILKNIEYMCVEELKLEVE